jgi:hypothetical protein
MNIICKIFGHGLIMEDDKKRFSISGPHKCKRKGCEYKSPELPKTKVIKK